MLLISSIFGSATTLLPRSLSHKDITDTLHFAMDSRQAGEREEKNTGTTTFQSGNFCTYSLPPAPILTYFHPPSPRAARNESDDIGAEKAQ